MCDNDKIFQVKFFMVDDLSINSKFKDVELIQLMFATRTIS
jgi:hypothetical protein